VIIDIVVLMGERPILGLLAGFLLTFLMTRGVTCLIRAQRGPFADLALGNLHLHHMVWGAVLVLGSGIAEFGFTPAAPWNLIPALVFGVGAALMLDEFALMIYLRDVYWSAEGRRSIDAVITTLVVVAMLTTPLTTGVLSTQSLPFVATGALVYVGLIVVCLLKGKTFTALAGALFPVVLPIGAVRLARPGSPWAVVRYRSDTGKQQRASRRYRPSVAHERIRQQVLTVVGGTVGSMGDGASEAHSTTETVR
jgi:hypothetical protein